MNPGPQLNGYGLARKCGAYGVPQDFLGRQLPQRQPQRRWQQWPLGLPLPSSWNLSANPSSRRLNSLLTAGLLSARSIWTSSSRTSRSPSTGFADIAVDAGGWVVDSSRYSLSPSRRDRHPSAGSACRFDHRRTKADGQGGPDRADNQQGRHRRVRGPRSEAEERAGGGRGPARPARTCRLGGSGAQRPARPQDCPRWRSSASQVGIKFLEETSAFSLIRVTLSLAAVELGVDAGPDQTAAVHTPVRFSATFRRPDGIEDYLITWDFGDGSHPVTVDRTASTREPGQLITATVAHSYDDLTGSPFIAQVKITGSGEGGIVKGEDTLTVSVSEVPVIEVFAGERQIVVDQNTEAEFQGSFTRPSGLINVRFAWNFGDGSAPVEGDLTEGITLAIASHEYANHRREPYIARLTVTADSSVGEVAAEDAVYVFVNEELGLVAGEYELGDTARNAVRGLTSFGEGLLNVLIWVAIFSPFWGAIVVGAWLFGRRRLRRIMEYRSRTATEAASAQENGSEGGD